MLRATSLMASLWLVSCAAGEAPPVAPSSSDDAPQALEAEGVVETADGVPMRYQAAGSGPTTLVFVHCWACDRSFWQHQLDFFADSYQVVALDLPGHGESGAQRDAWSIAGLAADVVTLLEAFDLQRVVLVGHSMGGPISLLAAPMAGDRVIGVALVDTVHNADVDWSAEDAAPLIASFEQDFEGTTGQFVPMMFPPQPDSELLSWVVERANAADHAAATALMADFPNLEMSRILSSVGVPVRAVNAAPLGMMIPATEIETNRSYADYDASVLDGVGHYLMLEKPAEFNALLLAALLEIEAD